MINFLKYISVFIIFGFIPIYFILRLLRINGKASIVLSIGYTPAIIALINIVTVSLDLQRVYIIMMIAILFDLWLAYYVYFKKKIGLIDEKESFFNILICILVGTFFGLFYWIMCFSSYELNGHFYEDTLWNFGIIGELKNHFPPVDPHWYTGEVLKYHYLSDLYFAGISNISKLSVIQSAASLGYLMTCLCLFAIVSMFSLNYKDLIKNNVIFLVSIMISYASGWDIFHCFALHLSGQAASTYFWSLPTFLCNIYLWFVLDSWRKKKIQEQTLTYKDSFKIMIIILAQVTITIFSKGSNVFVFILLELFSFVRAFINDRFWAINKIKQKIPSILSFSYWPLLVFVITFLFFNRSSRVFFLGLEGNDFAIFNSWNPMYPFVAFYGLVITYLLFNIKALKKADMRSFFLLLASFIQFVLFFIFKGVGQADLYFAFNAIMCLALFLMLFQDRNKLINISISYIILAVLLFTGIRFFNLKGFSLYPIDKYTIIANDKQYHFNIFKNYDFLGDLDLFKKILPKEAIIVTPNMGSKFFLFSAFMERRIWNESPDYAPGVRSEYAIARLFMEKENFIPEYINKKPSTLSWNEVFQVYRPFAITRKEYVELEDPSYRYQLYEMCAFGNKLLVVDCDNIKVQNKWTHLVILKSKIKETSLWLKTKKKHEGQSLVLFEL